MPVLLASINARVVWTLSVRVICLAFIPRHVRRFGSRVRHPLHWRLMMAQCSVALITSMPRANAPSLVLVGLARIVQTRCRVIARRLARRRTPSIVVSVGTMLQVLASSLVLVEAAMSVLPTLTVTPTQHVMRLTPSCAARLLKRHQTIVMSHVHQVLPMTARVVCPVLHTQLVLQGPIQVHPMMIWSPMMLQSQLLHLSLSTSQVIPSFAVPPS